MPRPTKYSAEYREQAVALVRSTGKPTRQVAREIGMNPETLRNWVRQDRIDRGQGRPGELTSDEKAELTRLRRRVAELELEKEILKKAAVFFAKETGQ